MKTYTLFTDGAARGNPGPAGIGVVIRDGTGTIVAEIAEYLGETTNNQAEYRALLRGLEQAVALGAEGVQVRADSELMVRQMLGQYKVKHPELRPLYEQARQLVAKVAQFAIQHIPREQNHEADALANRAIDDRS
ncbi:MAG: ribonuclease HI family protein [Deltaproteobacteria bacterium]|nr:ribonuclease HI family protein [Deltaproteobacteria bacterium]